VARGGVVVPIIADVKGLASGVGDAESQLNRLGKNVGKVGANLTKKLTLPILALGAGALAAFNEVDKGLDAVAIGTGATGEALQDLQKTFKNVAKNSTQGMEEIGNVVAELNTRLGLTGAPLEDLSTKMLQFARITGTDSTVATQKVTRAMNDAGIAAEDAGGFLDLLLLTSQKTGITVDTLAEKMTKFGSPMRQLGFSAAETAALLGSFELAGVNTDLVMGALRQSLGRLAKAGEKDLPGALRKGVKAIGEAKTGGEAAALAIELFGARAGPDMAAAIREGRLSVEDLVAELENADGTLAATAEAVEGPQEAIARMKNQITLIGAEFANVFIPVLERALPPISRLLSRIDGMSDSTKTMIVVFLGILAAIGPVLVIVGKMITIIGTMIKVFAVAKVAILALNAALIANPIGLVVIAIAALIAGLIIAYRRSETFRAIVDKLAATVRDVLIRAFDWAKRTIEDIWPAVQSVWNGIRPILELIGKGVELYVTTYVRVVATVIRGWVTVFETAYKVIKPVAEKIGDLVKDSILVYVRGIKTAVDAGATAFGTIRTAVNNLKDRIADPLSTIRGYISRLESPVEAVKTALLGIPAAFRTVVQGVRNFWNSTLGGKGFSLPGWAGGASFTIPRLAKGGIAVGPTLALIGEAGPEAVVPLDRLGTTGAPSGGGDIYLTVNAGLGTNPDELSRVIVESIKRYERRNGQVFQGPIATVSANAQGVLTTQSSPTDFNRIVTARRG
jgi:TP901 family phage tail tape measure protein